MWNPWQYLIGFKTLLQLFGAINLKKLDGALGVFNEENLYTGFNILYIDFAFDFCAIAKL